MSCPLDVRLRFGQPAAVTLPDRGHSTRAALGLCPGIDRAEPVAAAAALAALAAAISHICQAMRHYYAITMLVYAVWYGVLRMFCRCASAAQVSLPISWYDFVNCFW